MALVNLRDAATAKGLAIGYDPIKGAMINGNPIATQGLINYGNTPEEGYKPNTYYGTQEQIDSLLTPYGQAPSGLVSLRDQAVSQGATVDWNAQQGAMVNGMPVNTTGLKNFGSTPPTGYKADTLYGTPEQVGQVLEPYIPPKTPAEVNQALTEYQAWASQPYVSEVAAKALEIANNVLSRTFNYDPQNDVQFQLAAKTLTRNVIEAMAARGIAASSLTVDNVTQGVAEMMPKYQQLAYERFQDEGSNLMKQVDMLMNIDQTNYNRYQDQGEKLSKAYDMVSKWSEDKLNRWKTAFETRYTAERNKIKDAADKVEAERKVTQDMYEKWDNTTYATNDVALFFGVEPGTPSKEARKAITERQEKLTDQATAYAQQLALIDKKYENDKKVAEAAGTYTLKNSVYTDASKLRDKVDADNKRLYTDEMLIAYVDMQNLTPADKDEILKGLGITRPSAVAVANNAPTTATGTSSTANTVNRVLDEKLATMNNPTEMGMLIVNELYAAGVEDADILAKLAEYNIKFENGAFDWSTKE